MLCQKCSAVAPTRNLFRLSSQPFKQERQWRTRTSAREGDGADGEGESGEEGEAQGEMRGAAGGDDEQLVKERRAATAATRVSEH